MRPPPKRQNKRSAPQCEDGIVHGMLTAGCEWCEGTGYVANLDKAFAEDQKKPEATTKEVDDIIAGLDTEQEQPKEIPGKIGDIYGLVMVRNKVNALIDYLKSPSNPHSKV